ncbi:MAG: bifunctional alpha,alpha-trehalose-phosphate synthase (UDP-forming)/trehalose-phosphatase [Bacteroidia bacterium]
MRLIIVSNRAPVNIKKEYGGYSYEESPGGLASGLRAYIERMNENKNSDTEIIWIGWPGAEVKDRDKEKVKKEISKKFGTHCVFLSEDVMEKFYEGFCNKTIWPLFHYFPAFAIYEQEFWEQYIAVNKIFCDAVIEIAKPGDVIWIHDYHLMLLPAMLRNKLPDAAIGFFLHIPFPSYEIFRLLPSDWRKEILEGLYGADIIGFHTYDYRTYFLRSSLRILGLSDHMGEALHHSRLVKADTYPMGIDYRKYHSAALGKIAAKEKKKIKRNFPSLRLILSIDRQDYSKGILNRLKGYQHFLENNPEWKQKVTLMMVVVPSRIGVESYQSIKSRIDELVGSINGKFGNIEWMPIVYQYRSLSFSELIALYNSSDVALVTPLRDGMNLIAKEYIASRTDNRGVLILSEMAGAIDELGESVIINPNNIEEISNALVTALNMKVKEQKAWIRIMQKRLKNYDVFKWADDFLGSLNDLKKKQERLRAKSLPVSVRKKMMSEFKLSDQRILFLDYDGTLTPYKNHPADAAPEKNLLKTFKNILENKNTEIVLISGRDRYTLEQWFGKLLVNIVAEHGLFVKEKNSKWQLLKPIRKNWKKKIIPILNLYSEKLPGSFVEEKEYAVVFHYRKADPAFASLRLKELFNYLVNYTSNMDVQLIDGNKVLEVKNAGIDKGVAALHWLSKIKKKKSFIIAIGDDRTDEDLFRVMPPNAYSIRVGLEPTFARFNVNTQKDVMDLLDEISKI